MSSHGWQTLRCEGNKLVTEGFSVDSKTARGGQEIIVTVNGVGFAAQVLFNDSGGVIAATRGATEDEAWKAMQEARRAR